MAIKLITEDERGAGAHNLPVLHEAGRRLMEEYRLRMDIQQGQHYLMDLWFLVYNLVDGSQHNLPPTTGRYFTSRPASIVDTARRVIGRNPLRYHVMAPMIGKSREEREPIRQLENVLHGIMADIDRQMVRRGEMNSRMTSAFHSLVRGRWAFKLHLTKQAGSSTGSPLFYQAYDPRQALPMYDKAGVESVIAFDVTTLSTLMAQFPEKLEPVTKLLRQRSPIDQGARDYSWMYAPVTLLEWSSRDEHALMADLGSLPQEVADRLKLFTVDEGWRFLWLEEPYDHGYGISLIQSGNVNGVPAGFASRQSARMFSQHSALLQHPVHRGGADGTIGGESLGSVVMLPSGGQYGMMYPGGAAMSHTMDPAEHLGGRSIYASVAHLFPEMNEVMALYKDAVKNEVRGTWVFKSRTGQMISLALGNGSINPLNLQESLERVNSPLANLDVATLLSYVQQDISEGSLDLRFILSSDFEASGFARQRLEQASLTNLVDYTEGVQNWGVSLADSFITQYRKAHAELGSWKVYGRAPGMKTEFFVVDIDDAVKESLIDATEPPIIEAKVKQALPVDMANRINMAKTAIDPNNPLMSLITALDLIMEFDDADGAYDEILEDIGSRNPTIQLAQIAAAFERNGAGDLAQMIMQDSFRSAYGNATQTQKTTSPNGQATGTTSSSSPPELQGAGRSPQ